MPRPLLAAATLVGCWLAGAAVTACSASPAAAPGGEDSGAQAESGPPDAGPRDATALADGGDDGSVARDAAGSDAVDVGVASGFGVACSKTVRCVGGTQNVCLGATLGNYCSSFCLTDTDCPKGGVCAPGLYTGPSQLPVAVCLEGCTTSATCAAGAFCDTSNGAPHCMPHDCRSAPSVCSPTETCNQGTGACTATPLPAGFPATFPAAPRVSTAGGPTLTAPVFVPIFFSNDSDSTAPVPDMVAFFEGLGGSNYWKALGEYGIGAPTSVVPVHLSQPAPSTLNDDPPNGTLKPLLTSLIASGAGGIPAPTAQTVYVLVFPATTSVTQSAMTSGGSSCSFLGYHDELPLAGGGTVAYAVVLRCQSPALGFTTDLEGVTTTASHELVEAVTNPFPVSAPAFSSIDAHHGLLLAANPGTELGDMCEVDPEANVVFSDFAFAVQRFWSNAAAAAGHDPCVPAYPGEKFFTGAPVLPTNTSFALYGSTVSSDSVAVPVGQSGSATIDFYSDAATGPWSAAVIDYQCLSGGKNPDLLSITVSAGMGSSCGPASSPTLPCVTQVCSVRNGSTVTAQIHVNQAGSVATNGEPDQSEVFAILSWENASPLPIQHVGFGLVSN